MICYSEPSIYVRMLKYVTHEANPNNRHIRQLSIIGSITVLANCSSLSGRPCFTSSILCHASGFAAEVDGGELTITSILMSSISSLTFLAKWKEMDVKTKPAVNSPTLMATSRTRITGTQNMTS